MPKDPDRHYGLNYDTDRSSSSSEEDEDLIANATPEGLLEECFCGRRLLMRHETSGEHKGRAYMACDPTIQRGPQYRDRPHFRKWWDYSIIEEVTVLMTKTGEQAIRIQHLESENDKKTNEIEELKKRILELEVRVLGKTR